jgi:hypothetical protein
VTLLRKGMGRNKNLIYIPQIFMKIGAICIGKSKLYEQLFLSLEVDASKARNLLNWVPPVNGNDALEKTGKIYLEKSE